MIQKLLDQVRFSLGALREAKRKFAAQLAPDFRIFDYLRDDEMGLSKCLADLLDPNGKHGQSSLFLDSFLKLIDWQSSATNCKVQLEKQASGMRRIDIYLRFDEGVIGIENKPWAGDQKNQLSDYADFIQISAKNTQWKLIYLCNEEPSVESISGAKRQKLADEHHFVQLSYDKIVDWLETCSVQSKALTVRVYVEELAKFIRSSVNWEMDMSETNDMVKIISASEKSIQASFDVANALEEFKDKALMQLKDQLVVAFNSETSIFIGDDEMWNVKGDKWWNVSSTSANTGFTIWIKTNRYGRIALRFAFENKDYRNFFWGITSHAKNRPLANAAICAAIFENMKRHFDSLEQSEWWTCWGWLTSESGWKRNWDRQASPWIAINEGRLATDFLEFARLVQRQLNDNNGSE